MQRRILRTRHAAPYVGLAESTLEKMRVVGNGPPFVRLGARAVGYRPEDLDLWLERRQVSNTSASVSAATATDLADEPSRALTGGISSGPRTGHRLRRPMHGTGPPSA
jgi:predicted DNA-binding transcriptional regulator AlpA